MTQWNADRLSAIQNATDLFVAPLREDGATYGTPTQTWALVVHDQVYVRAASGPRSSWFRAATTQGAGRVHVGDPGATAVEVTFEAAGDDDEAAIDAAYAVKYPDSSAVPVMQGPEPKAAAVRIWPR